MGRILTSKINSKIKVNWENWVMLTLEMRPEMYFYLYRAQIWNKITRFGAVFLLKMNCFFPGLKSIRWFKYSRVKITFEKILVVLCPKFSQTRHTKAIVNSRFVYSHTSTKFQDARSNNYLNVFQNICRCPHGICAVGNEVPVELISCLLVSTCIFPTFSLNFLQV